MPDFQPGNKISALGGVARARKLSAKRRLEIARLGSKIAAENRKARREAKAKAKEAAA